ncbi:MAG TPA: prephenate dehydratase [Candidatus Altiarchaeales archaeon]|nr:prephenate dehydratase [Candidatus Altiarchaeales archaeon]
MKKDMIAVLGPRGTFTEIAARRVFRNSDFIYCDTVNEVFESVLKNTDFGVVAIENSLEGSINTTMDCLMEYDVKIVREIIIDINLCLISSSETSENEITGIISHPHALAQARKFLRKEFPDTKLQRHESTAAAIRELKNLRDYAAIGPKETAIEYGLKILREHIEDAKSQTRFIVISKKENSEGKANKTSIIFALKDRPGALYHFLGEFAKRDINLTKIESRPSKRKLGEYLFFIDFEGNLANRIVRDVIDSIQDKTTFLKILGSY